MDYSILCYRVMYRREKETEFHFTEYSNEHEGYECFRHLLKLGFICKFLRIEYLERGL